MWKIPLSDIDLGQEEINKVTKVLRSKWLSMGSVTQSFEAKFARYLGTSHAFGLANGTAALHIACQILGMGPGDEVIVPSLTFVATANAIVYTGATPVFADITSLDNFNISPEDILQKITKKTKAIMIMHYGGFPCDMDAIMDTARKHNLKVIEDAAHAPGAEYKGRKLGTIGDIGCFSFFSNKNMTTGEGGMIVTDDDSLTERIRIIRSHGMTTLTWDRYQGHANTYDVVELGYNYRINEIASALGMVQLKKLEQNNQKRKTITNEYIKRLKNIPWISIPFQNIQGKSSYHIFPVLLAEEISREKLMEDLKQKGIQSSIYYPPIHLFSSYRNRFGTKKEMLPKTEFIGEHELTLPLHPLMKVEDIKYICDVISQSV
jgi:dTDP-4-amino-4,6-dideoxygalactose transaminase